MENAMLMLAMKQRRTWSTRRPLFALDRIYYHSIHLVDVRVLKASPWHRLSDHFPVEATFEY
jgi:endonuclease/exonuclease/phosphatase family metal-dependent hydrolase